MKTAATILLLVMSSQRALAGDAPAPTAAELAALKAQNEAVVAADRDTNGVFTVQDDGKITHAQSGMSCPAKLPNATFYHALVYDGGKGLDVGCDYRRADDKGGANAKLTVFAVKAWPGATVDAAFDKYRNEVVETWKDAKSQGEALHDATPADAAKKLPPFRSEEFLIRLNNKDYTTQIYVSLDRGWVIEVRTTFVGLPNTIDLPKDSTVSDALDAAGDRAMGPTALMDALGTLGPQEPGR
jgi:hypothetical protein